MLDDGARAARSSACPVKTRHNEVAPGQYEIAPIFENSNVGSDHQQLTMQMHAERRPPLRARLPAAREAVRRRQRLRQAQQLVDGHRHRRPTCWTRATRRARTCSFLFFCAAVIQAVNKHQGLLRASVANIGQDHRLGANEAPPAIISIFLGAELEKVFEAIAAGEGDADHARRDPRAGRAVLPPLPMHGGDRNRTSPVRLHRQQVRVPRGRLEHVARRSRTRCSTRSSPRRSTTIADKLEASSRGRRRRSRRRDRGRQGALTRRTSRSASAATTTPRSGTPRPRSAA